MELLKAKRSEANGHSPTFVVGPESFHRIKNYSHSSSISERSLTYWGNNVSFIRHLASRDIIIAREDARFFGEFVQGLLDDGVSLSPIIQRVMFRNKVTGANVTFEKKHSKEVIGEERLNQILRMSDPEHSKEIKEALGRGQKVKFVSGGVIPLVRRA